MKKLVFFVFLFIFFAQSITVSADSENNLIQKKLENQYSIHYPDGRVVVLNEEKLDDNNLTAVFYYVPSYKSNFPGLSLTTKNVVFYDSAKEKLLTNQQVNSKDAALFYNNYKTSISTNLTISSYFYLSIVFLFVFLFFLQRFLSNKNKSNLC